MISFCVLCVPPQHRRSLTSKPTKVIIELYSSYQEISAVFENTSCSSIGSYSQLISNKYSISELQYSIILNGNINVYGKIIMESGNVYLCLIYYKDSKFITTLNKSSSLQLLDDAISSFIHIFIDNNNNNNNNSVSMNVLKNIQNTIDFLCIVNAQNSHESKELVYWDNRSKNYTQKIINNTPNKKPIHTNIFKHQNANYYNFKEININHRYSNNNNNNNNYSHNNKRHGDYFTHSKYKKSQRYKQYDRSKSFYASSNSQKNLFYSSTEYKWSRKSTTSIPQIPQIPKEKEKEKEKQKDEEKKKGNQTNILQPKYENKIIQIKGELTNLFELINELRLNTNDDDDENDENEYLICQSVTDRIMENENENKNDIDFISNATMIIHSDDLKEREDDKKYLNLTDKELKSKAHHRRSKPSLIKDNNNNFSHHQTMSDALIEFQLKYKKAHRIKNNLINNLKSILNEIQNHVLPSFDDDDDDDDNSNTESEKNDMIIEQELKLEKLRLSSSDWLKVASISTRMNTDGICDGLSLMKKLFETFAGNENKLNGEHTCIELYNQIYDKIIKCLSDPNHPNHPNISISTDIDGNRSIVRRRRRKGGRVNGHNRNKSSIKEVLDDCNNQLQQQYNNMMGTIGDDKQFKQQLTHLLIEVANNYASGDDNNNNNNNNLANKKRESLRIQEIKIGFIEKIVKIECDEEIEAKYWNSLSWDFDAIAFGKDIKIEGNCLVVLAWHLIKINNYHNEFGICKNKLIKFLYEIQEAYDENNLYHNKYHACDVVNNTYWFLTNCRSIASYLNSFDRFIMLMAAAVHDVDHDGKNNSYHARTKSYLAIRYNDQSILENHHISYSFKLISLSNDYNWIADLKDDKLIETARKYLIRLILSTDMSLHKKHLHEIKECGSYSSSSSSSSSMELSEHDKINLLSIILHACDIGNAAKSRLLCVEWAKRCVNEFRIQGDDEIKLFGKPSQLLLSRKHPLQTSQCGWITYVMLPYFQSLNTLLNDDIKNLIDNLNDNLKQWGKYKEYMDDQKDDK